VTRGSSGPFTAIGDRRCPCSTIASRTQRGPRESGLIDRRGLLALRPCAAVDQRPALVKTVDRSWDRLTGAWEGLTELWRRADTKTASKGAASAPARAPHPSTWRLL
jgi:hypothetical protein